MLSEAKKAKSEQRKAMREEKKAKARAMAKGKSNKAVFAMLTSRDGHGEDATSRDSLASEGSSLKSIASIMNEDQTMTAELPTWTGGDTVAVMGGSEFTIRDA